MSDRTLLTSNQDLPTIVADASLYDAMVVIDEYALGIALIVDSPQNKKLEGVITDGDIRRALINRVPLESPCSNYMASEPLTVASDTPRELVLAKLEAHGLSAMPILEDDGTVVGVHGLHQLIDRTVPNWALIMAGGKGTRLAPLTELIPKPLVPVAGRPIIERLLLHLIDSGIRNFVVSIAYLGDQIREFLGDGSRYGCHIHYLVEDTENPLGTAGALALLPDAYPQAAEQSLVLLNGDIVTQVDIRHLLKQHHESGAEITLVLRPYTHEVPFGLVDVEESGVVTGLVEKPTWRGTLNTGVYALSPSVQELLVPGEKVDATEVVQRALQKGMAVRAEEIVSSWQDVGTWDELHKARGNHD